MVKVAAGEGYLAIAKQRQRMPAMDLIMYVDLVLDMVSVDHCKI